MKVENIAKLARIGLLKEETEKLEKELSSILDYFNVLKKANSKKDPTFHPSEKFIGNVFREDIPSGESPERVENIISLFPDKEGRHIKVKAILNG
ncbi:MAG: hypothetical protein A2365_04060 [Candidatus Nealsonbacteria bacterium RIFOXYB1_FULL_40_15]|uniref:Aspartyl/glutamyl-tRNA(Asn/Gln) amidotransferase subunit C n=2 Tax=Candidatus Nealsoniibacteriota TaxID=1817911 RepID=A0A1G2ELN2_9BACT|nr:MAG: hypothetical protein A2427_04455 [Candidatus Nealsonbacteria bacterium RIFOXYC1_FULL_40_7]OGZ27781.1 MAG: hypothetical protein A2365_04060 [Candidatus Nealsonbacteria bacterium RIFOXYB1_FULL_40_15]OGZ28622.1 MAG: hypothetical protein A2562_03760 [Candidatus Nealsonbacteria bacterium RIFOXYD1_FULL_39_11]